MLAIIQHYVSVKQFSARQEMQQKRMELIKTNWTTKGFVLKILEDMAKLEDEIHILHEEVLSKLKVNEDIFDHSSEHYIGDEQKTIDLNYVLNTMNQLSLYNIESPTPLDDQREKAIVEAYNNALKRVLERFQKRDTLGVFKGIKQYIYCFDQAVLDSLLAVDNVSEMDARQVVDKHNLLYSDCAKDVFTKVAEEIEYHLEYSGEAEEAEPED